MSVRVNGVEYQAIANSNLLDKKGNPKSMLSHIREYANTSSGAGKVIKLIDGVCKATVEVMQAIGSESTQVFKDLSSKCSAAGSVAVLPYLIDCTPRAFGHVVNWFSGTKEAVGTAEQLQRKSLKEIQDVADGAACWGYAASMVSGKGVFKTFADVPSLFCDVSDLVMSGQDLNKSNQAMNELESQNVQIDAVKQRVIDTRNNALIRLAKAVVSVASSVLGMIGLVLGGPVLPSTVFLILGLAGTISAIGTKLHEKSCASSLIDFYEITTPQTLVQTA
jgi:hypothetical protein